MARRPNIQREAAALLAETLKATRKKLRDFDAQDMPVDAATISAATSLLKLVDAYETATRAEETADLERLRQEFAAGTAARAAARAATPRPTAELDPDAIRREYGLA